MDRDEKLMHRNRNCAKQYQFSVQWIAASQCGADAASERWSACMVIYVY